MTWNSVNLTKHLHDFYVNNYKMLMKENYKILDVSPIAKKVRAKMKEDNKFLEEFLK